MGQLFNARGLVESSAERPEGTVLTLRHWGFDGAAVRMSVLLAPGAPVPNAHDYVALVGEEGSAPVFSCWGHWTEEWGMVAARVERSEPCPDWPGWCPKRFSDEPQPPSHPTDWGNNF